MHPSASKIWRSYATKESGPPLEAGIDGGLRFASAPCQEPWPLGTARFRRKLPPAEETAEAAAAAAAAAAAYP